MRRQNHNGLRFIGPPGSAQEQPLLKCGICGSVLFSLENLCGMDWAWLLAIAGIGICTAHHFLGRKFWFFPGMLGLLVLVALPLRDSLSDGFCQLYNSTGVVYTARTGMVIPAMEASADGTSGMILAGWLGVMLGLGFSALWGWKLLTAAVVLLVTAVSLLMQKMADPLPLILTVVLLSGKGNWKTKVLPILTMAALLLLFSLPGADHWAQQQSRRISDAIHRHRYETRYTTLPEGRLEPLRQSDAPALIVTMEKPEVLYLRGFTGATFAEEQWLPLAPRILAENQELLYWLNIREFDLRAQLEAAASVLETEQNTVTVQNVGACSAYRYIPFTIRKDDRAIPENLNETAPGARYDSFTTVYGGAEMMPDLLTVLESEHNRYLQAEAAYRDFVETHYLSIPEGLAAKMQPYWEKAVGLEPQAAVKAVLENCYPDGIRHDPEYATAAVLTLRHFGIPARYAEGYITPLTTETTVELTGRHAACWAEVYQNGIGWVPMAQTPGQDGETEQKEPPLPPDTPEETLPPETEPTSEPQPDGGYQVRIAQALLSGAIVVMVGLLLVILLLLLRRKYILKKRQALLDQEDIREAITWSFADAVGILECMGLHRGNGSLDALNAPLRERFGADFAEQFEFASRINARALFSGKTMTETERKTVHGFRLCALARLQESSTRLSGFWMKYILCLF